MQIQALDCIRKRFVLLVVVSATNQTKHSQRLVTIVGLQQLVDEYCVEVDILCLPSISVIFYRVSWFNTWQELNKSFLCNCLLPCKDILLKIFLINRLTIKLLILIKHVALLTLQNHPLHIGVCNHRGKACRHLDLNIFSLDSNTYGCDDEHSYGCPYKEDVEWINQNLNKYNHSFIILFTHIPPPQVLGLNAHGINDERPCCWNVKDNTALPNKKPLFHVFGLDHNNLYITEKYNGTQFVNALKTGDHRSYGPDFANSGITRLLISNFVPSLVYSKTLNGTIINRYNESININYSYCGGSGQQKKSYFDR